MRKFPKLGIYVVMFTDIMKTFAQFFLVFTLFIIAFGLGFHMLLFEYVSDEVAFRFHFFLNEMSLSKEIFVDCTYSLNLWNLIMILGKINVDGH